MCTYSSTKETCHCSLSSSRKLLKMFWGLIMEPNERYTQVVEKPFHISQAALDSTTGENTEPCQVKVVVDGKNFLVCTLQKSNCLQVPLDLYFKAGDSVSFLTNGKSNIHLTGYLDPEFEDDLEDEEEDDEEAPALVEPSKKTKLENAADQKSKKAEDDYKTQLSMLKKQLKDATEQQTQMNESVQSKTLEVSSLREKITSLEAMLSSVTEEKTQNEDDYKTQLSMLKKQLKDATEQQSKGDNKLQSVTNNLRSLQEEKLRIQNVLGQKETQINILNESVQSKTLEVSSLRDKITSLEAMLSSVTEEKTQNENKSESLRVQLTEREEKIASLCETLSALESRVARLEVRGAQPEGDLQRASPDARDRHSQLKNEMLLMVGGDRYRTIGGDSIGYSNTTVGLVNGSYVVKADYPGEVWGVSVTQGPAGKVVATGGGTWGRVSNTMYIYDVAEDRWTSGPSMNTPRLRHSSVTVGTKVYVIGGRDQHDNRQSSVEVWDWSLGESSKWEYVSPMGKARDDAAAVVYKGDIYVTGGGYGVRSGEKYIVGNDTWVPIPDMVHGRWGHGLVTLGNKIYAIGGVDDGVWLESVESFDGVQWVEEPSLNVGRSGQACGVIGGEVYVVGGAGRGVGPVRSMEIFDPSNSKWTLRNITDQLLPSSFSGYAVVNLP